jgi:hypothetical protein
VEMFGTQMTLETARRVEVFERLLVLLGQVRKASEVLIATGFKPNSEWPVRLLAGQVRGETLLKAVDENRLILGRELEQHLLRLAEVLEEGRHEFVLATELGSTDPRAMLAMERANHSIAEVARDLEVRARRRMIALIDPRIEERLALS